MKKILVSLAVLVASISPLAALSAPSVLADGLVSKGVVPCSVVGDDTGVRINGKQIGVYFDVGPSNCNVPVQLTLAVWNAPNYDGNPLNEQTLFNHTTGSFGPGYIQGLTATLPDCFWQVDLVTGSSATAADGSPLYPASVKKFSEGGGQACTTPTPTPTPTPVTPTTIVKTVTKTVPAQPTALVNTGPGDVVGIVAGATALGALFYRLVLRRKFANK